MKKTHAFARVAALAGVLSALVLATTFVAGAGASSPDDLQAVKAATARFHSFEQAEKAGYSIAGEPCVASPLGTMGIHAVNAELMDDPTMAVHYDLHVWLWQDNPTGLFAPFNPRLACP